MKRFIAVIFVVLFAAFSCVADILPDGGPYVETIEGIAWTYTARNGEVWVGGGSYSSERAVPISTSGQLVVPSCIKGCPVVGVSDFAFHSCAQIESILIPEGVRKIGDAAFIGCKRLKRINIPSTVSEIIISLEGNPFTNCSALEAIEVSEDNIVYKSKDGVLYTKSGDGILKVPETRNAITITEPIVTIFCGAFYGGCLAEINLPSSVKIVQSYAFSSCERLTSVIIPASVENVGRFAFNGCLNLKSLTFLGDCPLTEVYGWSVSPSATFFIVSGSQRWESDTSGKWNGHDIRYLTAEQEFLARVASVRALEDLKTLDSFLRYSSFCFSDRELRDCVYVMLDCVTIDNCYIDSEWLHFLGETLSLSRMRGILTEQDSANILKRVLPIALICTERELAEFEYALDNRLCEYSELVSLLGSSMPEEWRVSVMEATLDSLEKYEGKSMGLFAGSQLFRALSPKLSDTERMAVFERVLAIAASYDDTWESYCGLEDWAKALFDDAPMDVKMEVIGLLKEKSNTSHSSIFLSVEIRLCIDWFGATEVCGVSLDDCVGEIEEFDLLDEHLFENLSDVMLEYDDDTRREAIVRIADSVCRSIRTEGAVSGYALLLNDCTLPGAIKATIAERFVQTIINAGPRRGVVSEYAELLNVLGEMPAPVKDMILQAFVSMAKDEIGTYYILCDLAEIICAIGEVPFALRQEILALCIDVSKRDEVTDDVIYGIAEIIDALGELDESSCQMLVSRCASFIEKGLVAYARFYGTLCMSDPRNEIEGEVLFLLEKIAKQAQSCKLLYGIIDITAIVSDDLTLDGKECILRSLLEVAKKCDDPLQGIYIYCEVYRMLYGEVEASSVLSALDYVIVELDVNHLGECPIDSLWSIFQLIDVESYDVKQRREIIEAVLRLMRQNNNSPDRYYGIKGLCELLEIELSREEISLIVEDLYSSMLAALMSDPSWSAVSGCGYGLAEYQKDQAGFSDILCRLIKDMKSSPRNTFLIQCIDELLESHAWGFDRELVEQAMREIVSGFRDNEMAICDIEEMSGLLYGDLYISGGYINLCGEPFLKVGTDVWKWRQGFDDRFNNRYGDDLSASLLKTTGKLSDDGQALSVWHDYVAGTDPLDIESKFTSSIEVADGIPIVRWNPDLGEERVYKILGSTDLKTWVEIPEGHEADYSFFKVTVEMK